MALTLKQKNISGYFLVLLIAAIPLFAHLDEIPVQFFDESRLAMNALEMHQSHNVAVTTYDGLPDYWNTKPPLMIWLLTLSMNIFGITELALRLPSALAALFTCLFLFWFFHNKMKNFLLGILAPAVLVCIHGYVTVHGTRTGDYDALFTMFTTMYCFSFFIYLEEEEKKWLYLTFIFLGLGIYTKGIAAMMLLPALFIYTIYTRKLLAVLKSRRFYICSGLLVLGVAAYYCIRQYYDPGYFKAVRDMELGGRFLESLNNKKQPYNFYVDRLIYYHFRPWLFIMPLGILLGGLSRNEQMRRITLYACLVSFCFIGILSAAATKFDWYMLPAYPFLAILTALFIWYICRLFETLLRHKPVWRWVLTAMMLLVIFYKPYAIMADEVINPKTEDWTFENQQMGFFMKDILHRKRSSEGLNLVFENYEGNIRWYLKVLRLEQRALNCITKEQIVPGQKLVVYQDNLQDYVEKHFHTQVLETYRTVKIYQVNGTK